LKVPRTTLLAISIAVVPGTNLQGQSSPPEITETVFALEDGGEMRYAISVPADYQASQDAPRPLVLALHPGGRFPYYGSDFMQSIVEPALREWDAILVAPDVPSRSWASADSERAVLALLDEVISTHTIDQTRILVTGFSMGGRGTWYFATRNPQLFTGAIPMAAARGTDPLEELAGMPVHLIQSPDDKVVPYPPAEEAVEFLARRGRARLTRLSGVGHYQMRSYIVPLRTAGEWIRDQWQTAGAPGSTGAR
jgi:predicted peptidase